MITLEAPKIRWRRASSNNEWLDLLAVPEGNLGFAERQSFVFTKPEQGWTLFIDDERLRDDSGDHNSWSWTPGFFAGEVTAELVSPSGTSTLYLLDVAPDSAKLGRDVFREMVDEIWNEQPELLFGNEPATIQVGELGATQNPWLEFARLRRHAPAFLQALNRIRRKPLLTLRVRRDTVPLHRVRRVDRRTALSMARTPAVVLKEGAIVRVPVLSADIRLDVPSVEESVDSAANRSMLALTTSVLHRTRTLRDELQKLVAKERVSETRTAVADRWPMRRQILDELVLRLEAMRRRSPFSAVRRAEITSAGLTAVAADPTYAGAWASGWRALRHGVEGDPTVDRLWISPSWEVYERWCFVRLSRALRAHRSEWGWRCTSGGREWVGRLGARRASLSLQPTFASFPQGTTRRSVSRERVPDLMFSVESNDETRFALLDAKYRTSKEGVLDAMASAHVYQDSLRVGRYRPETSLLLVPRGGGAAWLEEERFQKEHCVGVSVLSPMGELDVPQVIQAMLNG